MSIFDLFYRTKDRKLGISEGKGRYDLPLNQSAGTQFLILLIALMTFLVMMALAGSFALSALTNRWSSGLENALTIEIPAMTPAESLRSPDKIAKLQKNVGKALGKFSAVAGYDLLDRTAVRALLSPWFGEGTDHNALLKDMPLPGLVSVRLKNNTPEILKKLKNTLETIAPDIRIDAHENWLGDILRLAGLLNLAALLITLVILLTTITAIAGAIRSRMAEHEADIALLHMMGASDLYIMRQFRRHALIMGIKGGIQGVLAGGLFIAGLAFTGAGQTQNILPDFSLTPLQIGLLALLPALICLIAGLTSRFTVLRVLSEMP